MIIKSTGSYTGNEFTIEQDAMKEKGCNVTAIKLYRTLTGVSLFTAKSEVERIARTY